MKIFGHIFFIYVLAFSLMLTLSTAKPSNFNVKANQNAAPLLKICPSWISGLPGGCRRFLRLKRSLQQKDFCPAWRPQCPKSGR